MSQAPARSTARRHRSRGDLLELCRLWGRGEGEVLLNYGLTFASKGSEGQEEVLEGCSSFSVKKVAEELDHRTMAKGVTLAEAAEGGAKKEMLEASMVKVIAMGSGKMIHGILWCGEDFLRRRDPNSMPSKVSRDALKRMKSSNAGKWLPQAPLLQRASVPRGSSRGRS